MPFDKLRVTVGCSLVTIVTLSLRGPACRRVHEVYLIFSGYLFRDIHLPFDKLRVTVGCSLVTTVTLSLSKGR